MLKTRKLVSLILVVALVLSMAVVGIVSASAAEGDYYLMGSFNGWAITDGYAFTENSENPGEYVLKGVTLSSSDTFKVKQDNGDGNTGWFPDGMGNDGTVDADGTYNIYFNPNGNPEWKANSGYCYLELVGDNPEPGPDPEPGPGPIGTITVNFEDTLGWGTVYAHSWPTGGTGTTWPGEAMTDNGDGTFTASIPSGYNVVFTAGSEGPQTVDVDFLEDGATYCPAAETDEQGHHYVNKKEEPINPDPDTEAPQPDTEAPQPDTEAPQPDTEAPQPSGKTSVTVDGKTYDAHVGDTVHYEFLIDLAGIPTGEGAMTGKFTGLEGILYFDTAKLKVASSFLYEGEADPEAILPNCNGGTEANIVSNGMKYNAANGKKGYDFSSKKALLKVDFEVIADGESEIVNTIKNFGSGEVQMVYLGETKVDFPKETKVTVECPHTPATEEKTDAPIVSDKAVVTVEDWNGTTETREFNVGDEFTVISYLQVPEGKKVNSININQTYNEGDAILALACSVDDDEEWMFPQLTGSGLTANDAEANIIKANNTAAKYKGAFDFPAEDSILIRSKYKVTANGSTKIKTNIVTLATITESNDMSNQIAKGEKVGTDDLKTRTVFDGEAPQPDTQAPETKAPETEPETKEPETTAPETKAPETEPVNPIVGNSYYLTGSIAGWGLDANYLLTRTDNTEAEEYSISGITLTTSDMIKAIKSSKSGTDIADWYPDGMDNNITVDTDSTYTVLFRPNGDGTAEDDWIYSWFSDEAGEGTPYEKGGANKHGGYLFKLIDEINPPQPQTQAPETEPETKEPETTAPETQAPETKAPETQPETQPDEHKLWVVADGKWYAIESGTEYTYVYYLNTGEKVCSLDAETFYDEGVELQTNTEDLEELFPIIKDAMVLNDAVAGRLKYNYSAAKGKDFNTNESELIKFRFVVNAEEGVYHINTFLHTVAGADEHKYIFKDEVLDPPTRNEGLLVGLQPGPAPVTEPVTQAPETQAPETQAPETEPETKEPETTAPETQAPETKAPETQAPETQAPETQAPETKATEADTTATEADTTATEGDTSATGTTDSTSATGNTSATSPKSTVNPNSNVVNNNTVQTGSTEMAIIFLMVLVMAAGVVIFTKKRKFDE